MAVLAILAVIGGVLGALSWGLAVTLEDQLPGKPAWATIALATFAPQLVIVALGFILIQPHSPSPDAAGYAGIGVAILAMISLPICLFASVAAVHWDRRRRRP